MYDIYTEVASFMNWINETILSMGGMQSCGLTLENRPTEGKVDSLYVVDVNNHHDFKSPGPVTEAPPPSVSEDTIVLLTGGKRDGNVRLSSSEVFPSTSGCTPPPLPAARADPVLFTTPARVPELGGLSPILS